MKKKLLIRCALGFLLGVAAMYIVPSFINHCPITSVIYTDELLARTGSPAAAKAVSLLVMGLFGALCFGGTLFYEIESWPLALATAAHYLSMSLGYLIPNWLLCWNMPLKLLLTIEAFMALGLILIWLIIYCIFKKRVRELNELMKKQRKKLLLRETSKKGYYTRHMKKVLIFLHLVSII